MKPIGAVVAGCLLVSACSGPSTPEASTAEDQKFVDAMVAAGVLAEDADESVRDDVIQRGKDWCKTLSDPETTREDVARALAKMLRESNVRASQRATVLYGTAAKLYCPDAAERLG